MPKVVVKALPIKQPMSFSMQVFFSHMEEIIEKFNSSKKLSKSK